jgi:hypothetical protein
LIESQVTKDQRLFVNRNKHFDQLCFQCHAQ